MSAPNPRRDAFAILRRVDEGGAYASALLEARGRAYSDPRDAALLTELVLGVLRRRGNLDRAVGRASSRAVTEIEPAVLGAIRLGAYALLYLDRIPDFAAVDTAVALVKEAGRPQAAGFVNGVLRTLAREGRAFLPSAPEPGDVPGLALFEGHPEWWTARLVARTGWENAAALLAENNLPAATTLATWPPAGSTEQLAERLRGEGVETAPCRFAPRALRVVRGVPQRTSAFHDGAFWIQDEASQLAVALLGESTGPRIADLCAAPGGKTLALLSRAEPGATIVAADRHVGRLSRLTRSLLRVNASGVMRVALDATRASDTIAAEFDDVAVDAPCTGTGTLRRHPEIRWRLREEDLVALAARQGRILDGAAPLVAVDGRLLYSVCSMEPEEGEQVIEAFLARHPAFRKEDPRPALPEPARALVGADGALRTSPRIDGMDGFFAALLRRVEHGAPTVVG